MDGWRILIVCSLLSTACQKGTAENPKATTSSKPVAGHSSSSAGEPDPPCSPDVARTLSPKHLEALTMIDEGSASKAETAFGEILREKPGDRVAAVFLPAARTDAAEIRRKASQQASRLRPLSLPVGTPQAAAKPSGFKLEKSSEAVSAASAFDHFQAKGMPEAVDFVPPEEVGHTLGDLPFSMAFQSNGAHIARYQDSILALGNTELGFRAVLLEPTIVAVYPDANKPSGEATLFPEVNYATVVGSTLLAQISHNGDGSGAAPDAFVIAYDLKTNQVKWTSQRGVGNTHGPAVTATHYFTAFTTQDGASTVQVLDLANGKLVAEQPLQGPSSWLAVEKDSLFVWAPTGQRFTIPPQNKPAAPEFGETLRAAATALPKLSEARRCQLDNAAKALDARDEVALRGAVEGLPRDSSVRRAAQGALDFIEARKKGTKGIDLSEVTPRKGARVSSAKVREMTNPTPLNVKIQATKEVPISGEKPLMGAVVGVHPELRSDLFPSTYGAMSLYGAFGVGEDTLLNYGNRYLATVSDNEVKQIVDLAFLSEDPAALGTEGAAVSFLGRHGELLIATVGSPLADGSTAYIAALDPKTSTVVWRTDAGLANYSILWFADYGIALFQKQKKTEIVLFRIEDGKIIHSLEPKEPPTELSWDYRGAFFAGTGGDRQYYFVK